MKKITILALLFLPLMNFCNDFRERDSGLDRKMRAMTETLKAQGDELNQYDEDIEMKSQEIRKHILNQSLRWVIGPASIGSAWLIGVQGLLKSPGMQFLKSKHCLGSMSLIAFAIGYIPSKTTTTTLLSSLKEDKKDLEAGKERLMKNFKGAQVQAKNLCDETSDGSRLLPERLELLKFLTVVSKGKCFLPGFGRSNDRKEGSSAEECVANFFESPSD